LFVFVGAAQQMASNDKKTIREMLEALDLDKAVSFKECDNIGDEFALIKRAYFKKVLVCHPDKGGNVDVFRNVQVSFEVLRELFDSESAGESFATAVGADDLYGDAEASAEGIPTPSWEFYAEAADEEVPAYKVEPAKSARSLCTQNGKVRPIHVQCLLVPAPPTTNHLAIPQHAKQCVDDAKGKSFIAKGSIRIGSIEEASGSYGRWKHLGCWRVPSKVPTD